jgi:hypothetical protein
LSRLPPGWPLTGMLIGYPLWWLIGLAGIIPLVAAVIMAVQLAHLEQRVRTPRGLGFWLLFLLWVVLGVFLLQIAAPNAIADHSNTRYVTFAFRLAWYASATITGIYIYNMRDRLPTRKVIRAFGWLFVTVVVGGVIGTLASTLDFPSLFELFLPKRLTHVQYVHDLIHPVIAQRYSVDGVFQPRASAPFAYTNDWGLNCATLLPFFVIGFVRGSIGWRRWASIAFLAVAAYPIIMSQNRGVWLALVLVGALLAFRAAFFGRIRTIVLATVLGIAAVAVLAATPLGNTITNRLDNGYSNAGRASLSKLTVDSVLERSPVVGLGSTRNVQGSFYSIAGGDTAECSLCSPPALGTQGQFWLVIFSTGVGGMLFYLGFLVLNLLRGARRDSPLGTLAFSVLVIQLATMFVYDGIGVELITMFAALGLLWRDLARHPAASETSRRDTSDAERDRTPGFYTSLVRSNLAVFAVLAVLGFGAGLAYDHVQVHPVTAETQVLLPPNAVYPDQEQFTQSLDTLAGLVDSVAVRTAVAAAAGIPADQVPQHLSVTASPNTRILHIRFTDSSAARAERASLVATKRLIAVRTRILTHIRNDSLASLAKERAGLTASIATLGAGNDTTNDLVDQVSALDAQYVRIQNAPVPGGTITQRPTTLRLGGDRTVDAVTGLALGLLLATVIAYGRALVGVRAGRARKQSVVGDLWVLDRVAPPEHARHGSENGDLDRTVSALAALSTYHVVSTDERQRGLAASLQRKLPTPSRVDGGRVALVAGSQTRMQHLTTVRDRVERCGVHVTGIVLQDHEI